MASYVVMEQPGRAGIVDVSFLRDGFSWLAFFVPPLWLLWHRLWFEALSAFLVLALLSVLGDIAGWVLVASLLTLAVSLYVGLEGQNLRVAALGRRGWREWGAVEAKNLADAETRYAVEAAEPVVVETPRIVPGPAPVRPAQPGLVLGLGSGRA
jgi:hypothetical protein